MRLNHGLGIALVIAILVAGGCSSNNKGKIEGTKWSSLAGNLKGKPVPAGVMRLDFGADGSLVFNAGEVTLTGRYSLQSGDYVTLLFKEAWGGKNKHQEKVVIDGDRLTMTDSDGTRLTFQKTK